MKAIERPRSRDRPFRSVQHLRLRGDVEPGDDLVGENEIGREQRGARDADALALAAGELVRIAVEAGRREVEAIEDLRLPAPRRRLHSPRRRGTASAR